MKDQRLIILAAGMGSRYGGLKQIDPVGPNGELLIEYSIFDALAVGFQHIVFVIQRDQEHVFQKVLGKKLEGRCSVRFVCQELTDLPEGFDAPTGRVKPWGTAHAVLSCRDVVTSSFAVINADDFYGRESYACVADALVHAEDRPSEFALVGFDLASTLTTSGSVSRGVCSVNADGFLARIDERTHVTLLDGAPVYRDHKGEVQFLPDDALASMNMWAFPGTFMQTLQEQFSSFLESARSDEVQDEFFLPGVVGALVAERRVRVRVLRPNARWMGMTYREDVPYITSQILRLISKGQYPSKLW